MNGANNDLLEIHENISGLCVGYRSRLSPAIHHFRRFVQVFIQLFKINYQQDWNKITVRKDRRLCKKFRYSSQVGALLWNNAAVLADHANQLQFKNY